MDATVKTSPRQCVLAAGDPERGFTIPQESRVQDWREVKRRAMHIGKIMDLPRNMAPYVAIYQADFQFGYPAVRAYYFVTAKEVDKP